MPFYILDHIKEGKPRKFTGKEVDGFSSAGIACLLSAESFQLTLDDKRIDFALRAAQAVAKTVAPQLGQDLILAYAHPEPFDNFDRDEEGIRRKIAERYFSKGNMRHTIFCHSLGGVILKDIFTKFDIEDNKDFLVVNLGVPLGRGKGIFSFKNEVNLTGHYDYEAQDIIARNGQKPARNSVNINTSFTHGTKPLDPHLLRAYLMALSALPKSLAKLREGIAAKELPSGFAENLVKMIRRENNIKPMNSAERRTKPKSWQGEVISQRKDRNVERED